MRLRISMCSIAIALCGCSTLSQDFAFSGKDGKAFAMVVGDGMPSTFFNGYVFVFQKVDVEKSTFLAEWFRIYLPPDGEWVGDELKKPTDLKTTMRFGGTLATAGNYALVSRIDSTRDGVSQKRQVNCFSLGTPVFNIGSGSTNLLAVGNVKNPRGAVDHSAVESESKLVLAGYPNISAPVRAAEILGGVTFEVIEGGFGREDKCGGEGIPVSFRPAR